MKTPAITLTCLTILAVWLSVMALSGQSLAQTQHSFLLLNYGAMNGADLADNQYWKLVASQFTHVKFYHMLANVGFIYYLGRSIEIEFGSLTLFLIYIVSGTIGQFASVYSYPDLVSSGASQALCGLAGFIVVFSVALMSSSKPVMIAAFIFIAIQVGLDLSFAGYLKAGHYVGFFSGVLFGFCAKFMPGNFVNDRHSGWAGECAAPPQRDPL